MLSLRPALIRPLSSLSRQASTLVLAEHDNAKLSPVTLNAITAANTIGGDITCLVAGSKCGDVAKEIAGVKGVTKVSETIVFSCVLVTRVYLRSWWRRTQHLMDFYPRN